MSMLMYVESNIMQYNVIVVELRFFHFYYYYVCFACLSSVNIPEFRFFIIFSQFAKNDIYLLLHFLFLPLFTALSVEDIWFCLLVVLIMRLNIIRNLTVTGGPKIFLTET